MKNFNEWLSQRDSKVYSEMFDEPVSYKDDTTYFNVVSDRSGTIKVVLTKLGMGALENLTKTRYLNTDGIETMGSHLVKLCARLPEDHDIDLTPVRTALKQLAPQAELALDAALKRFATRVGRKLGNDGNMLFTLESAKKGLRQDPSRIAKYKAGIKERATKAAKLRRLEDIRSLGFNQ